METVTTQGDRFEDYNEYRLEIRDPYGLVWVIPHMGRTPDDLSGCYTSIAFAREAVDAYIKKDKPNKSYKDRKPEKKLDG